MATYTLEELRALITTLALDDNGKVSVNIGKVGTDEYQIMGVTEDGATIASVILPAATVTELQELLSRVTEFSSDSGTATGGAQTTLIDTLKNWEVNLWQGAVLEVYSVADNIYYLRTIASNTATTITMAALPAGKAPAAGDPYAMRLTIGLVDIDKWGQTALTGRDITLDIAKIGDDVYTTPTHASVTAGSTTGVALAANANRIYALFQNISNEDISIEFGDDAVLSEGIVITPNNHYEMSKKGGNLYVGVVNAICTSGGKTLLVTEGV